MKTGKETTVTVLRKPKKYTDTTKIRFGDIVRNFDPEKQKLPPEFRNPASLDGTVMYMIQVDTEYAIYAFGFTKEEAASRLRAVWERRAAEGSEHISGEDAEDFCRGSRAAKGEKPVQGVTSRNLFAKLGNVRAAEYLIWCYGGSFSAAVNGVYLE